MKFTRFVFVVTAFMLAMAPAKAEAFIFFNEIFADPATSLAGDSNGDGVRDSSDDEFIELYNSGTESVDLSGWSIADATSNRHTFGAGSLIDPNGLFVVFGGGVPVINGDWQIASTGQLNLNNTAETVKLFDAGNQLVDSVIYGSEANFDQSLVRSPEGTQGPFVKHSTLPNANGSLFSPAAFVNQVVKESPPVPDSEPQPGQSTVPEPATMVSLISGLGSMFWMRKKKSS